MQKASHSKAFGSKMFSYQLPGGGPNDVVTLDDEGNIKFDPPVYEQRYTTAVRILEDPLWNFHFKKIIDFGCGEMSLLRLIRRLEHVEHILNIDVDEEILNKYQFRAVPLLTDHLKERDRPLRIEVLKGSIMHSVENLRHTDAVVAIEVIEHLFEDVLAKVPENIFGFIQPKLVIMSTPNQEYNVLFKGLNANGFRIDDHKFEWTRKQFEGWASSICKKYKNYSFTTLGVGSPPIGYEHLGTVTQIGIFARNDIIDRPLAHPIHIDIEADSAEENQYKEIYAVDFPFHKDERSKEQKLKDEITYYLSYTYQNNSYYDHDLGLYKIPIDWLVEFAERMPEKMGKENVISILNELNYDLEEDFIILTNEFIDEHYRRDSSSNLSDSLEYSDAGDAGHNLALNHHDDDENWD